ncbi:hypothetical protein SRS16P2_00521 (plasmid) [Variovorax sp. SRS16]|nr:hypothetical protein SRS16P2_00521 [Variovorax sp. SRS16]
MMATTVLVASLCGMTTAQTIPASSADSGRRAVISVDQATITNNVNNAQSTANAAYNYAGAAYNYADAGYNTAVGASNYAGAAYGLAADAQARAINAQNSAGRGGFATALMKTTFPSLNAGGEVFACVWSWPGVEAVPISGGNPGESYVFYCPAGSGKYVLSTYTSEQAGGGPNGGGM